MIDFEACRGKPAGHHLVLEAETDVGVGGTQFLTLVCREIHHQQSAARGEHPRRLGDRRGRRVCVVQHLMDDDRIGALVG